MDFMNRGASQQPAHTNRPTNGTDVPSFGPVVNKMGKKPRFSKLVKMSSFLLLVLVTLLAAAVVVVISTGNRSSNEVKLVDTSNLQAVFLTNGQVYFGNIKSINNQYIDLINIYYLTTNQQVQPTTTSTTTAANSQVSLVKLGCELHAPQDQMSINRSQVTFWENLKSDGQVAKAVTQYKTANPNGQNCSTASSAASTTPVTSTTPTTGTTTKP